jgi:hypothetical protein
MVGNLFSKSLLILSLPLLSMSSTAEQQDLESTHHEYRKNVIAGFIGATSPERRETNPAFGIEYERRISTGFGIGALAEYTAGDEDFWIAVVPFALHKGPWKFYVAPGFEDSKEGTEPLLRLGGEYGFEVGRWEISPQIDVDFVDGDQVPVMGVTFGIGF